MGLYEIGPDSLVQLKQTSLAAERVRERQDLQRLLRDQIEILDPDLLVIAEEFASWDDSQRRIDILAVDKDANVVVVELKRNTTGGHMELQALRYASMVSAMTWANAVNAFGQYMEKRERKGNAEELLLSFLEWEEPRDEEFAQDVRILLASPDFGKELTTSVLWLNQRDIDIRCIQMQPFTDGDRVLLNVRQILPLPEAEDFRVQLKEKARRERQARSDNRDMTRYDVRIGDVEFRNLPKRRVILAVVRVLCSEGVAPAELAETIFSRQSHSVLRSVEGHLDGAAFDATAKELGAEDKNYRRGRWFSDDAELIHHDGRTYALTRMWDTKQWRAAMALVQSGYPTYGIVFEPSAGA